MEKMQEKTQFKRIIFASDHAGAVLRRQLFLKWQQHMPAVELGKGPDVPLDYPDIVLEALKEMYRSFNDNPAGVFICGSGIGMSMAANRVPWVRAALCKDCDYATLARAHNDANILVLGARFLALGQAEDILATFLTTPFEAGRHRQRVDKLKKELGR